MDDDHGMIGEPKSSPGADPGANPGEDPREDPREGPSASPRPSRRSRLYPKLILGLLGACGGFLLLEKLWAAGPNTTSWLLFAGACGCGLLAIAGWWSLTTLGGNRVSGDPREPGLRAWVGFPFAFLGFLGMIPLLVLAVSPEARLRLDPGNRIRANLRRDRLEILFPRPTFDPGAGQTQAVNLTVDDTPIPVDFFAENPQSLEWRDVAIDGDRRLLVIDYARLRTAFRLEKPNRIGLNAILDVPQIRDASRMRLPQQWVTVGE